MSRRIVIVCDKCGAEDDQHLYELDLIALYEDASEDASRRRFDLCGYCANKVRVLLDGEDKT